MKKSVKYLLSLFAVVLVFIGAYFLYQTLSEQYKPQNIAVTYEQAAIETEASQDKEPETAPDSASAPETTPEEESAETTPTVVPAPDFTVQDVNGDTFSLSDFKGKPVVLNFWASWCPPCKGEMPDFESIYQLRGDDVHFLMVNLTDGQQETLSTASAFIAAQGYTFPVYYDTALDAATKYGIYSVPATYFIDAEGNAVAQASGAIDAATLEYGISLITE